MPIRFQLILVFLLQISIASSQDSGIIYDQVMEMQKDFPKESTEVFLHNDALPIPSDANQYVSQAEYFELKESFIQDVKEIRPNTLFLEIPFEGGTLQTQLYKKDITTSNYKVKTASGAQTELTKSIFYRGVIKGISQSIVSLSITNKGLRMTVNDGEVSFEINKVDKDLYAAYRVSESGHSQNMRCSTNHDYISKKYGVNINESSGTRSGECIEIYIECDFDSYITNGGSVQNTEDWALAIMNEVGVLYENIGVPMVVSEILVYDAADPYLAGSDAGDILNIMATAIGNDYNGRLAHVFSTRSVGGGIAWVDVLCASNNGGTFGPYAVSGSMNPGAIPFPIYSWNVMVVAHELGHNIGSLHTHDCVWNGNNTQIDDCGNQETDQGENNPCYNENNPILPTVGSIMSYCHLIGNIGIDFNVGFHPQVGTLLLDKYLGAPCSTGDDCGAGGNAPIADFTYTQFNSCNPAEVQFTDLSQNIPNTYFWEFPGGNPEFSADPNPLVVYEESGIYDVSLMVSNSSGEDVLSLTQIITVLESPIPNFDNVMEDGVMKFSYQTTVDVTSYFWDFGDANVSTDENPCHQYEEDGSYLVVLSISSACGDFKMEKIIDFFTLPIAAFEADATMGCTSFVVNYTNESSENSQEYLWLFEGGTPGSSTDENPTVVYDSTGIFAVTLIVSNDLGEDTLSYSEYITVNKAPTAGFEYSVDAQEVSFTNTSANYTSLTWDFGDGNTSTEVNPTHTYTTEGTYEISLKVTNFCDTVTTVQTIVLSSLPTAGYTVSMAEGCLPLTVMFTNNSSINTDVWHWSFPGGDPAISTEENPIVVYNEVGIFDVKLVVMNESGADSLIETSVIAVRDIPTTNFDYGVEGLEVAFNNLSADYNSVSWDFGDGNSSTENNPTHVFIQDGSYEVELTTTNSCGSNTTIQTINVSSLPTANFSADVIEECIPFVVSFINNSSSNATSFKWSFPGGTPSESTEENPIITYETAGVYNVSLTVESGAGEDVLMMENYIISKAFPIANFEYTALSDFEYSFTSTSIDAESYSWDFGDGKGSIEEHPIHLYEMAGTYDVLLTASNSCGDEVYEEEVTISITSANEIEELKNIEVHPNPNTGDFTLSLNSYAAGEVEMEIYNALGQKILKDKFEIQSGSNQKSIRMSNPISGVYLMVLRHEKYSHVLKVYLD